MMTRTKKTHLWAWLNLALYVITLAINYAGANGFINGMSQKDISGMYPTLITPAPFTFSIWGIIYLLILATIIQMIVKNSHEDIALMIQKISPLFWINVVFNAAWIISFSYKNLSLSLLFIFCILISLTKICRVLIDDPKLETLKLAKLTFGLYAGWVTIATVVNVAALLVKINWKGFGIAPHIWTIITLIIALVIVTTIAFNVKNCIYPLAVLWAFFGILMAHKNPKIFTNQYGSVQIFLMIGMVYLVLLSGILVRRKWHQ